jgi:hypothetical protein
MLNTSHFYLLLHYYSAMNEFALLIEEWETDIQLLEMNLRHPAPQVSPSQAQTERRRMQRALRQARQAQVLLYGLSQAHKGAFSPVA